MQEATRQVPNRVGANGPRDAMRHCLFQGVVAYNCGRGFAADLGNAMERDDQPQPFAVEFMDQRNNAVGRRYAAEIGAFTWDVAGQLIQKCRNGLQNRHLIWLAR